MATPNYGYEKRQRELAKKKKKEEKQQAKTHRKPDEPYSGDPHQQGSAQPGDAAGADAGNTPAAGQ